MIKIEINEVIYLKLAADENRCSSKLQLVPGKEYSCDFFATPKTCREINCKSTIYLKDTPELRAELAAAILEQQ